MGPLERGSTPDERAIAEIQQRLRMAILDLCGVTDKHRKNLYCDDEPWMGHPDYATILVADIGAVYAAVRGVASEYQMALVNYRARSQKCVRLPY